MRSKTIPLLAFVTALVVAAPAAAQSCLLAESPREGDCFRLTTETMLSGTLKVSRDGKVVPIRIAAKNEHTFAERVVTAEKALIRKSVRNYVTAVSRATIDGERVERALNPEHRLIVAQRTGDALFSYSPAGPLTRTELDVVSEHFDTLHLAGILPGKEVNVGDTWKIDSGVAQSICLFDGLIAHTLAAKLKQVIGGTAIIGIEGTAKGIENGALADLTVTAEVRFDVAKKRIVAVEWKQKDVRDQGPVSPAAEVETTTVVKREPLDPAPDELGPAALATVPLDDEPPSQMRHLLHRDPKNRYQFLYACDWHIVGQTDHHLVMRLLDRGDFIAQATITQWRNAGAGKHMTPDDFEKLAADGTGWKSEEVLERGEVPTDSGRWIYHVTARGELEGSKVVQNFYVVADANGDQVIVTFTMRPAVAARLGTRDLSIVNAIDAVKK